VRREVEAYRGAGEVGADRPVTVSVGVVSCPQDGDEPPLLLERADEALHAAKAEGGNRVCRFRPYVGTGVAVSGA
jgi:GGDEF domain-containing protein